MYNPIYICFSENGETVHENPYNWEGACYFNVSIIENKSIEVGVFPNPFNEKFSISSSKNAVYRILNSAGQNVQEGVISIGEQSLTTQDLNKGVYFLQVSSESGGLSIHRLVKI
ncbi:MAG: T9SS type A sorting domain-containing protein [Flavobacteriales bacterium]